MDASEKGKEKEKEKEDENGGGSRKILIFELDVSERTENYEDSDEEIDTNFLGIECSFYPKKKKRLKTVGVQYSMEELCSWFHNSSVGRTEVTQQLQHNNREQVQGQKNTSDLEQLQLQEMSHQDDIGNISETDPSKNDNCEKNNNCAKKDNCA
ncbi:hypothetical protein VNO80_19692 [Phaseolus coccineus]|uniref:Uncharacterized protein n=1 Tax=Phaseolus coccineus TaxID=3886 RepID=A0AAN9MMQ2_PHACN